MGYKSSMSTWLNPDIEYLFNVDLYEWDCMDAGFSIIQQFHLLDDKTIQHLRSLDKLPRHIEVGKIQGRDKDFSRRFMEKFAEVRNIFITTNDLTDNDIVSVKRDAIFTTKNCTRVNFGKVRFRAKNLYSSYIRFPEIRNLEMYYGENNYDIKGMGEVSIDRHRLYMIDFLRTMIQYIENQDRSGRRYLMNFIEQFKRSELDDGYYIEFNNMSKEMNPLFNYQHVIIPIVELVEKEL